MVNKALGLIETIGLAAAIEAADAAVKAAKVTFLGYELTKGKGLTLVKFEGDVGAVQAAVEAGVLAAQKVNVVWAKHVIPRPHNQLNFNELPSELISEETFADVKEEEFIQPEALTETFDNISMQIESQPETNTLFPEEYPQKIKSLNEVCNLCGDPACPRKKGEPRVNCINYAKVTKEVES